MPSVLSSSTSAETLLSRNVIIALGVVVLHVGLIWGLQSGLLIRAAEILIPVTALPQWVDAPAQPAKPQPAALPEPALTAKPTPARPTPVRQTTPTSALPLAVAAPAAQATVQVTPAPSTPAKSVAPTPATNLPTAPAAAVVQQPASNADYLQNPKPAYPSLSARLGETGRTVYKVWIGVDGKPQRAELVSSSGFPRLDKAAYDTVMAWRYVPGMRNGVAETMAVNVPIHWELRS